jgi:hypothetical protein
VLAPMLLASVACELDPPECALSPEIESMRIRGGPTVPEFIDLVERPVDGLVVRDGDPLSGTWSLALTQVFADTARLGEQCPDLSLEARAAVELETTGSVLVGDASFVLNSWTVEGWEAEIVSTQASIDDFDGTLRMEIGGDDFDRVDFSGGTFGGNDGETSIELGFSTR